MLLIPLLRVTVYILKHARPSTSRLSLCSQDTPGMITQRKQCESPCPLLFRLNPPNMTSVWNDICSKSLGCAKETRALSGQVGRKDNRSVRENYYCSIAVRPSLKHKKYFRNVLHTFSCMEWKSISLTKKCCQIEMDIFLTKWKQEAIPDNFRWKIHYISRDWPKFYNYWVQAMWGNKFPIWAFPRF